MCCARRALAAAVIGLLAFACRAVDVAAPAPRIAPRAETGAIEATLNELYRAFCFDAGQEADWKAMRELFADGAVFVAPIGAAKQPRAVGNEEFLRDFQAYVASDAVRATGLHERIIHARIDVFGHVAHAFVVFEGFRPGEAAAQSRGLDSIQLVLDGERWLVVSFTTQYESTQRPLPARFLIDEHVSNDG